MSDTQTPREIADMNMAHRYAAGHSLSEEDFNSVTPKNIDKWHTATEGLIKELPHLSYTTAREKLRAAAALRVPDKAEPITALDVSASKRGVTSAIEKLHKAALERQATTKKADGAPISYIEALSYVSSKAK